MVIKQVSEAKGITIESRFKATKTSFDELFTEEINIPLTRCTTSGIWAYSRGDEFTST